MTVITHPQEAGEMRLIRSAEALQQIEEMYRRGEAGKKELRSYFLPDYQRDIIDLLSDQSGESKAAVVRAIIDEWCEIKLREPA